MKQTCNIYLTWHQWVSTSVLSNRSRLRTEIQNMKQKFSRSAAASITTKRSLLHTTHEPLQRALGPTERANPENYSISDPLKCSSLYLKHNLLRIQLHIQHELGSPMIWTRLTTELQYDTCVLRFYCNGKIQLYFQTSRFIKLFSNIAWDSL